MTTTTARFPATVHRPHFDGQVLYPGTRGYDSARSVWNGMIDHRPNVIVRCASVGDVVTAVRAARERDLEIGVRCGGHNIAGLAVPHGGLMIDVDLARPATGGKSSGLHAAAVAYATSKLAILYYAHELQRHAGDGIGVSVFEPGFMPGTSLPRRQGPAVRALARALAHLPGMPSPSGSAPALASVVLDDRWARLRDGAFVLRDKEIKVEPWAHDRDRERRLWEATTDLLERAALAGT